MNPRISVIMPVYNSEKYIKKSINSVLNQTFKDIELIIINDGSKDDSELIIKDIAKNDHRINYYEIANSGSAVARNVGLEHAKGEFIAFVDSDDYIDVDMFNILFNKTKELDVDIVSCSYERIFSDTIKKEVTFLNEGYYDKNMLQEKLYPNIFSAKSLHDEMPKTMWTKIYRRKLIEENDIRFIPELKMSQDVIFTTKCLLYCNSFYYLPNEKLYKYMHNEASRTNTYLKNAWKILKNNYVQLVNMSEQFSQYPLKKQLPYALVRNSMTAITNEGKSDENISKEERIQSIKRVVLDVELQEALLNITTENISFIRKVLVILMKKRKVNTIYYLAKLYNLK